MAEIERSDPKWVADAWIGKLVETLRSMTDERPEVSRGPFDTAAVPPDALIWEQRLSYAEGAALWVAAPPATWNELGSRILKAAGIEEVQSADARNTWLEIVNQVNSALCQALGADRETEVTSEPGSELPEPPPGEHFLSLTVTFPGSPALTLLAAFSAALTHQGNPSAEETEAEAAPEEPVIEESSGTPMMAFSKTFDLLLDVGLPVSVSFGRTHLPIRDVLKLTTGSIVELNRTVSEPVEVIVNGCVIARGDVVVVEGNYGVRIRQIVNRQHRLRTGIQTSNANRVKPGLLPAER